MLVHIKRFDHFRTMEGIFPAFFMITLSKNMQVFLMLRGYSTPNTQNDAIHTSMTCLNDARVTFNRLVLSMLTFKSDSTPMMHGVGALTCEMNRYTLCYDVSRTQEFFTQIILGLKLGVR
jgi:hypothetical protein